MTTSTYSTSRRPLQCFLATRLPYVICIGVVTLFLLGFWFSSFNRPSDGIQVIPESTVVIDLPVEETGKIDPFSQYVREGQYFNDLKAKIPNLDVHQSPVHDIPVDTLGYNAVVLYLMSDHRIRDTVLSLKFLHQNVPMIPWPIVLFYSEDMEDPGAQTNFKFQVYNELGGGEDAMSFVQRIEFVPVGWSMPPNFPQDIDVVQPVMPGGWPGYHLMCQFFAAQIFDHPRLQNVTYYMRLDTDSYIFEPVCYDPIDVMHAHNKSYGWRLITGDAWWATLGLWDLTDSWARAHPEIEERLEENGFKWPEPREQGKMDQATYMVYYNNFEIVKLETFRRPDIRAWLQEVLKDPWRFLKYRWGDAAVRYGTVNMFLDTKKDLEEFCGLIYYHNGVQGRQCDCEDQKAGRA